MIKKTFLKNILREVRFSLSRFIAIFTITALGAGVFAGLRATGPNMRATANLYYQEQHLMDYRLLSTMGFTEDDIQALREDPDVEHVMPTYGMDVLIDLPNGTQAARIHGLPADTSPENQEYLNQVVLQEGRLPATATECVVDSETSYQIGDKITVSGGNESATLDMLRTRQYTVVGRVISPYYIALGRGNTNIGNGRIEFYLYVPQSVFDSEYYTEVYITLKETAGLEGASGRYTQVIDDSTPRLENLGEERAQLRYDEIYDEASAELEDARQEAEEELAKAWQTIEDAEAELADARREIEANAKKLADAQKEIQDAEAQIASGGATLAQKQAEYDAGVAQYNVQKAEYDAALAQYNAGLAAYNAGQAQINVLYGALADLDAAAAALQGILPALPPNVPTPPPGDPAVEAFTQTANLAIAGISQLADAMAAAGMPAAALAAENYAAVAGYVAGVSPVVKPGVDAAQNELDASNAELQQAAAGLTTWQKGLEEAAVTMAQGKQALDEGWAQLSSYQVQLADAKAEVEDGQKQLADARKKVADAEKELADGKIEYEEEKADAERQLADAEAEIEDGQKELDDLAVPEWYVLGRDKNPGYSGFWADTDRIDAIAFAIPLFFFLVAVLVCLTTMTRMVEEQRTQIGTFKALGFGRGAIAFKYISYAAIASTTGAILGVIFGFILFPSVIWGAYKIMYVMPDLYFQSNTGLAVLSVVTSVLCTTLATVWACVNELRSVPAQLMRPKAPRAGTRVFLERIPPIWNRMRFSQKVTARNLFRYKKRFFMTIVGVAGCTALLLTGFGVRDSISGIAPLQFGKIDLYDMAASLEEPSDAEADTPLNDVLPELGKGLYAYSAAIDAEANGETNAGMTTYLYVAEKPEELHEFIDFHTRVGGQAIAFPQGDGVVITEKLATALKVGAGDEMQINRANEKPVSVKIIGVMENYVQHYVYMTPETFEKLFGETPLYSNLLLVLPEDGALSEDETLEKLIEVEGVTGAVDLATMRASVDDMLESLDAVVWVIIIAAGALAFVVLYNLTNINITERAREIATLKVLGFYNGEVAAYVYRENILLTCIGTVIGLVMGVFLHRYVMTTVEVDEVMFRRAVEPISYVLAAIFTVLCAVLVNLVMLPRLKKIDMVESLKSAE